MNVRRVKIDRRRPCVGVGSVGRASGAESGIQVLDVSVQRLRRWARSGPTVANWRSICCGRETGSTVGIGSGVETATRARAAFGRGAQTRRRRAIRSRDQSVHRRRVPWPRSTRRMGCECSDAQRGVLWRPQNYCCGIRKHTVTMATVNRYANSHDLWFEQGHVNVICSVWRSSRFPDFGKIISAAA